MASTLRELCTGALLLAGFNACFAIATYISYKVLGDAELGRGWFMRLMEARDFGFSEIVRVFAEVFNWCALGLIAAFFAFLIFL